MDINKIMEEIKKRKVISLISNKILSVSLNSNISPPARLRFIELMLETYADAIVKDHILLTLSHVKVKDGT